MRQNLKPAAESGVLRELNPDSWIRESETLSRFVRFEMALVGWEMHSGEVYNVIKVLFIMYSALSGQ